MHMHMNMNTLSMLKPSIHARILAHPNMDPQTHTQVCEALAGMSDPEEASLLRANVLEEVAGKELSLATDAASATLLEQVRCLFCGALPLSCWHWKVLKVQLLLVLKGVEGAAAATCWGALRVQLQPRSCWCWKVLKVQQLLMLGGVEGAAAGAQQLVVLEGV